MKLIEYIKERKLVCEDTVMWVECAINDEKMEKYKPVLEGIRNDLHRLWDKYDYIYQEEKEK